MKSTYAKKRLAFAVCLSLGFTLLSTLASPTIVAAVQQESIIKSARFLDADQIRVDFNNGFSSLFKDTDPMDGNLRYEASGNEHGCGGWIDFNVQPIQKYDNILDYTDRGDNTATADINVPTRAGANAPIVCEEIVRDGFNFSLKIDDFDKARNVFRYVDSGTIERVDGNNNWVFERSTKPGQANIYFRTQDSDAGECKDFIQIMPPDGTSYLLFDISKGGGLGAVSSKYPLGVGCKYIDKRGEAFHIYDYLWNRKDKKLDTELPLGNPENKPADINKISAEEQAEIGGVTSDAEDNSCESGAGPLGWILCPVLNGIENTLGWVDEQIVKLLEVDKDFYDNAGVLSGWNNIKNMAYIILVPVMLVMVIGTALGFELLSAYTIKKALPRLVIATIFISLSYTICVFLIELTNSIGFGTQGLMTQPFTDALGNKASEVNLSTIIDANLFTGTAALPMTIGAAIALWVYGTALILPAILALLVLLLRQMFIVGMVLLAPLAILAWIFPGNDKLWRFWWGTFSKMLLMFPLIMGLLALGKIFAFIIDNGQASGLQGEILQPLMALSAYILPYALIPFTFKFAGGALATISGMANDRSKGLSEKIRQSQERRKGQVKAGDLPGFLGGRRMGSVTSGLASGPRGWKGGRRGMQGYRESQRSLTGQTAVEANGIWQSHKNDDKFLTAHANEAVATEQRNAALAKGDTAQVAAWDQAIATAKLVPRTSATRMASAQAWAATGYNLAPGQAGYRQLSQTISEITGASVTHNPDGTTTVSGSGAGAYSNAMNNAQFGLKNAGRVDLAGINDGAGYDKDAAKSGVRKLNSYSRGQGKTDLYHGAAGAWLGDGAVAADGKTHKDVAAITAGIENSVRSGSTTSEDIAQYHSMLIRDKEGANDANKLEIQRQLDAITSYGATNAPLQTLLDNNNREFRPRGIDPSERET